jgi:hypothetical protein
MGLFKMCWTKIDARGWNTYRRKVTDPQSGNRGRDSEVMGGLLDNDKSILKNAKNEAERSH